jgi:hypothetical protein
MDLKKIEQVLCEVEKKHNTIFHRKTAHFVAEKLYDLHKLSHEKNDQYCNDHSVLIRERAIDFKTPIEYFKVFLENTIPFKTGNIYIWAYVSSEPHIGMIQPIIYKSKDQHDKLLTYQFSNPGSVKSCGYLSGIIGVLIYISKVITQNQDVTMLDRKQLSSNGSLKCDISNYLQQKFAGEFALIHPDEPPPTPDIIEKGEIVYKMIIDNKFKYDDLLNVLEVEKPNKYGSYSGMYFDIDIINSDQIAEQESLTY